jgi:M6 family metalloprotease-like protein
MKHRTILFMAAVLLSFTVHSRPARKGVIPLMQPDGSMIEARISGDEFSRLTTDLQGSALIQDKDGWWCYASFDSEGRRKNSGWKAGYQAPPEIIRQSRDIPYERILEKGRKTRSEFTYRTLQIEDLGSRTKGTGETAVKHVIVIPAQFKDVRFTHSRQDFADLLTKPGYSENGAHGSAKEYFDTQFGGRVEFIFEVSGIVTLPDKMAEYGGNDDNGNDKDPARMVTDACKAVDEEIDFSLFDDDNDGEIDNVFILFAGGDEAEGKGEDCIWSHSWYVRSGAGVTLSLDGKILNSYACASELTGRYIDGKVQDALTGIGTFCHEYSHTFGLPDFYDTDYEGSGGNTAGLWLWTSLMDGGNQNAFGSCPPSFNVMEREILGLCEPVKIEQDGIYSLKPIGSSNAAYRLDTDNPDEYYLLEYRNGEGWDKYTGGSGMLVYHIDKSTRGSGHSDLYGKTLTAADRWGYANEVNCRTDHQCADLLEADGRQDGFTNSQDEAFIGLYKDIKGIFFPSGSVNSIVPEGRGLPFWSGILSPAGIYDITEGEDEITFRVSGLSEPAMIPKARNIRADVFTDAAIIQFESSTLFNGEATVEWSRNSQTQGSAAVSPYQPGKYSLTIENLAPDNKVYTLSIVFKADGVSGETQTVSFMTKRSSAVKWPYIHLNNVQRNEDGTFPEEVKMPLRVANASGAAEINWTFNGSPAATEGDGYYRIHEDGILKAEIIYEDGSVETIMKEVKIRKEGQE